MEKGVSSVLPEGLLSALPGWLFVAKLDGQVTAMSPAMLEFLGAMEAHERLHERIFPEDLEAFTKSWAELQPGAAETIFEARVRSDGQYPDMRFRLRRGSGAAADQIYGVVEKGTGARLSTDILDSTGSFTYEAYLRVITDYLPLVVWAIDKKGIFTLHKGKAMDVTGITANSFLGKNIFDLYGDGPTIGEVRRGLAGEVTHSANDLHGLSWENWILPIRDKHGVTHGAVGCSLNVTESKRFERELQARLRVIEEQQALINTLSTPIIQVWDQVLTLPLFGNVDSERAGALMDNLLREVVHARARFAILDLTGVEVIDTSTASHLVNLIRALRLLGTEGIITGIKARIAQTVVGLGVDLTGITTLSTLQSALRYCMERM